MHKSLLINGKIFCWPLNGIRRVTEELVLAMDNLLDNSQSSLKSFQVEIVTPENFPINLKLKNILTKSIGTLKSGYFVTLPWEQCLLPMSLKKDQVLLNLGNFAPMFARNSIVMLHDAQVFITPESYERNFRLWHQFVTKVIGKTSKKILTVSEFSKQQLIKYGIAKAEKINVIHLGCDHIHKIEEDTSVINKLQLSNKKYVVAQARTTVYKNIPMLFKAISFEKLNEVTLVLYGSGNKKDYENMGVVIPENVLFTGRLSDAELKALIGSAVATLSPSTTEGFGLQPLEGMALGCPAIVAPCGAMPEVCGDAALYADPHKPEEWAEKIRLLLVNEELAENIKNKSLLRSQEFTWEKSAKKLLNILNEIN